VPAEGNRVDAAVDHRTDETGECRRLAEYLDLDAVGVMRTEAGRRRVSWWVAPGSGPLPLDIADALEGRAEGWVACPRGDDVVFARLTPRSSVRSVSALRAMLSSLAGEPGRTEDLAPEGGAPEDRLVLERTRWAYAIHDGLTQIVTAAVLELEWMARRVDLEPSTAAEALARSAVELRRALGEIRGMLAFLSQEEPTGEEPLEKLVQEVLERWRLPASWSVEGDTDAVPLPVLQAASSVIRESVANAAKHSASTDVAVKVHATRRSVEVQVEDRGRGFRPSETGPHDGHLGLEMMRRRVEEVRGTLDIESSPGRGTRVVARLPVGDEGDET